MYLQYKYTRSEPVEVDSRRIERKTYFWSEAPGKRSLIDDFLLVVAMFIGTFY